MGDNPARDYLLKTDGRPLHAIIAEVAKKHGISYADIVGKRRHAALAGPRFEAYWRCKNETGASYPEIGRVFSNRDHTSIVHGVKVHEQRMKGAASGA